MPLARRRNRAYAVAAAIIVPCAAALFTLGAFAGGGFPSLPGPARGGADPPPGSLSLPSAPPDTSVGGGQASTTVGTLTSDATIASTATHPHPRSMTASTYRVTTSRGRSSTRRDATTRRITTVATTRGTSTTFGTTTDGGTTDTTLTTTDTTTTADTTTPTVTGP